MASPISKNTIERIAKDIKFIRKNPLHDNGIYYKHSDEELLTGYALIVGPKDSYYQGGFYLFKFDLFMCVCTYGMYGMKNCWKWLNGSVSRLILSTASVF